MNDYELTYEINQFFNFYMITIMYNGEMQWELIIWCALENDFHSIPRLYIIVSRNIV